MAVVSTFAAPPRPQAQPIEVTAKLEEQTYCAGDKETFTVHLKLRLHFVNHGSDTLIVSKDTGQEWYEVIAAKTTADLANGKYEYNPNTDWFTDVQDAPDDALLGTKFAILAPGESFQNTSSVAVVVSFGSVRPVVGTIGPGNHVLQLKMSPWNYLDSPEETRKRWERRGHLFSQTITTEPVAFEIPTDSSMDNCH